MICRSRCLLIGLLALVLAAPPLPAAPRSQEDRETAGDTDWSRSLLQLFPLVLQPLDCLLFGDCSPGIDPNGTSGVAASGVRVSGAQSSEAPGTAASRKPQNFQ